MSEDVSFLPQKRKDLSCFPFQLRLLMKHKSHFLFLVIFSIQAPFPEPFTVSHFFWPGFTPCCPLFCLRLRSSRQEPSFSRSFFFSLIRTSVQLTCGTRQANVSFIHRAARSAFSSPPQPNYPPPMIRKVKAVPQS